MAARTSDYACALILQENRILLGRRAPFRRAYPGCWDVIGGRVEAGETCAQALIRELDEEIGIVPTAPVFFRTLEDRLMSAQDPPRYHVHLVRHWQGVPHMRNHEHSHLEWFTLQQALDLANLPIAQYRALFSDAMSG
ncbi:MAG: NUDIX domain-containing protein [Marinibacterium sp.]|nr:NUDIX domain-containing protein [Marinibacterium sp.]